MSVKYRDSIFDSEKAGYLDLAGAVTSGLCALHCALMPALAAILPMIGLGILRGEGTETALLGTSAALATVSIGLGYRRHRSGHVVAMIAAGLSMLVVGHLAEKRGFELPGVVAIVAGGLAVAGSHLLNRRLCRSCTECREAHPECGGRLAPQFLHVPTPVASGTAGRVISQSGDGPSDPGTDR